MTTNILDEMGFQRMRFLSGDDYVIYKREFENDDYEIIKAYNKVSKLGYVYVDCDPTFEGEHIDVIFDNYTDFFIFLSNQSYKSNVKHYNYKETWE